MSEKVEMAELVDIPEMPKGMEVIPVSYDADKMTDHLSGFPLDFQDENKQIISFNIYKGTVETTVKRYENLVMTEENKKEFKEIRTTLNKHLDAINKLKKDIKSKINTVVENELQPLLEAEENLKNLVNNVFKLQIDGFDEKQREDKYNNKIVPYLIAYLEVNGEHYKITREDMEKAFQTDKTPKTKWIDYLKNSTTADIEIQRSMEMFGKWIIDEREKETLKNHKIQTLNQFLVDTLESVNRAKKINLKLTDINIKITAETSEAQIQQAIKEVYQERTKKPSISPKEGFSAPAPTAETIQIVTGKYELTYEIPENVKEVYTFAVGFSSAEERDNFVAHMINFPGYKKMFLKNLDTFKEVN